MLWLNKHARFRTRLSPYIDGRLTASETTAFEAHLASCEVCRHQLEELRATVLALRRLPQTAAPRSFAITPGMLEPKTAAAWPARRVSTLGLGMRLAGAGVAVALAIVFVGDLTLGDNGGASREAGNQPAGESRLAQAPGPMDTSKSGESGAYAQPSGNSSTTQSNASAAAPCPPAAVPPANGSTAGGAAGGAGGPASGGGTSAGRGSGETPATATPEPAPTPAQSTGAPTIESGIAAACGNPTGGAAAPVVPGAPSPAAAGTSPGTTESATARTTSAANDGGGTSTLRVAEIVLAGMLIAIVAGVVLEAALRRRGVA